MMQTEMTFVQLREWIIETIGTIEIIPELPEKNVANSRFVSLYLKSIRQSDSTAQRPVKNYMKLILSYLITIYSDKQHESDNFISELLVSAMTNKGLEVDPDNLSTEEWISFGIIPRPSLLIHVPLGCIVDAGTTKLVERPLVINGSFK